MQNLNRVVRIEADVECELFHAAWMFLGRGRAWVNVDGQRIPVSTYFSETRERDEKRTVRIGVSTSGLRTISYLSVGQAWGVEGMK